jgi:hypothetical protein
VIPHETQKTGTSSRDLPAHAAYGQTARVTFPERKHLVQTFFLVTVPLSFTLTV